MPTSALPPVGPHDEGGSLVLRFGTAVGLAAGAAVASALPATLRISGALASGPGLGRVWLALAAAALGPMVAAIAVLRGAREGLRGFGGSGAGLRICGVGLWLTSLLVGLALFGGILRATTHHHALAGVTFACGAVVFAMGSGLLCVRIVVILGNASPSVRRVLIAALAFVCAALLAWVGFRFVSAASRDPASSTAGGTVLDILAFALAALFAARRSLVARRAFALVGPPVAVVILAVGLSALRDQPLRDAIGERAPVFVPLLDLFPGG